MVSYCLRKNEKLIPSSSPSSLCDWQQQLGVEAQQLLLGQEKDQGIMLKKDILDMDDSDRDNCKK